MLKLALPLAGLSMAGQGLPHKASRAMTADRAHAGLRLAASIEGAGGRSTQAIPPPAGMSP